MQAKLIKLINEEVFISRSILILLFLIRNKTQRHFCSVNLLYYNFTCTKISLFVIYNVSPSTILYRSRLKTKYRCVYI